MKVFQMLVAIAAVAVFSNVSKAQVVNGQCANGQCANGQCQTGRVTQILDNTAGRVVHGVGVVIDGVTTRTVAAGQALLAPRQTCPVGGCQSAPQQVQLAPVTTAPVATSQSCEAAPKQGLIRRVVTAPVKVVQAIRSNRCR